VFEFSARQFNQQEENSLWWKKVNTVRCFHSFVDADVALSVAAVDA